MTLKEFIEKAEGQQEIVFTLYAWGVNGAVGAASKWGGEIEDTPENKTILFMYGDKEVETWTLEEIIVRAEGTSYQYRVKVGK